jgi:hypothetical protein
MSTVHSFTVSTIPFSIAFSFLICLQEKAYSHPLVLLLIGQRFVDDVGLENVLWSNFKLDVKSKDWFRAFMKYLSYFPLMTSRAPSSHFYAS